MDEVQSIIQEPAHTAGATFSAFYRRIVPTLATFLMWQGARLPEAADIAQVTMNEACRQWPMLCEPDTWARRVASREFARRIARVQQDPADEIAERRSLLSLPQANVAAWEQQHGALRVLGLLPPRQRQVMAWSLEEYTPAEIAKELRIAPDEVLINLKQARKALAQHLGIPEGER